MGSGADGSSGGHAGPAQPGTPGGRVEVTLAEDGAGGLFVTGERLTSDWRLEPIRELLVVGEQGFVELVARGGAGGAGGRGGSGGDGARGHAGRDASRYSRGSDGGPGGDGGAGGRGSSGAHGGAGGAVVVRVRDEDTHLLMLVRHGVEGGPGGPAGAHGPGGSAGPGGRGGSSHSWTTTETSRGPNGETRTHTRFHSNPGGSSGRSGHPGPSGSGPLFAGARGPDGALTLEVETAGGTQRFGARYHLELVGLEVRTPDADGVTEPGERIELHRVRVENVGGMPTPRHRDVTLEVLASNWARPLEGARLVVPRGLAAGASVELEGVLPFELRDYVSTASSDPLSEQELVTIDARVPDVSRSFGGFLVPALDASRTLVVRFPVAASILEALPSLAPGEATRLRFAIRNQSRLPLGARSEGRRRVRVRLRLHETELDDRDAACFDEHGLRVPLGGDGLVRELDLLESGADWVFEGALGIAEGAPGYRALRLRLTLEVGRLDAPETLREVQHRDLEVRVAERLGARPFDWLLVTSHRTTRDEVEAWRALAARTHHALAIYDLSLHGDLALDAAHEGGPSILERAQGGLIVLPGYALDTPHGPRAPASFLSQRLLGAMARARADLLLLGGPADLRALVAPEGLGLDPERPPADGADGLLERLHARRAAGDDAELAERVAVHEVVFGFEEPSEKVLAARAQRLAERLARLFPEREHEVVWELDPDRTESWAPIRRRRLGWLRVLARASRRSGLAHLGLDPETLHDPVVVDAPAIALATLLARGVDDRLASLGKALAAPSPDLALATSLADAVLLAVAAEQLATLRRTRAREGLDRDALRRSLAALEALAGTPLLGGHGAASPAAGVVARLVARARFFSRAQVRLWERIPGISWARRTAMVAAITGERLDAFVARQGEDEDARRVLADRVRVELEALEAQWRAAKESGTASIALFAQSILLGPAWTPALTLDEELVLEHEPRALSSEAWAARRAEQLGDEARAAATAGRLDEVRARLLADASTAELLARAAALEAGEDEPSGSRSASQLLRSSASR
jgi:hypothetical protein